MNSTFASICFKASFVSASCFCFVFQLRVSASFQAMQNLLEMGFEEDDVIDALRNHGNRQEEAVGRPMDSRLK